MIMLPWLHLNILPEKCCLNWDGWMHRWMDGWKEDYLNACVINLNPCVIFPSRPVGAGASKPGNWSQFYLIFLTESKKQTFYYLLIFHVCLMDMTVCSGVL